MNLAKWFYRGGHPNRVASVLNRLSAAVHALGIARDYLVTLEVCGRRSGRKVSLPLVMAVVDGQRYLVSMLGAEVDWVRNVKAANGDVTLRHGLREQVLCLAKTSYYQNLVLVTQCYKPLYKLLILQ